MLFINKFYLVPVLGALIVIMLAGGCSGGSTVLPATEKPLITGASNTSDDLTQKLLGEYSIKMTDITDADGNVVDANFEIVPVRTEAFHVDVTQWIVPLNVKFNVWKVEPGSPMTRFYIAVKVTNPKPLGGWDVRGILYTNDEDAWLQDPDGMNTCFNLGMPKPINAFMAFNKETKYRPFGAGGDHTVNYIINKNNSFPFVSFVYKITASYPGNAEDPVNCYVAPMEGGVHPYGSNAMIYAFITDWQDNVEWVKLDLSSFGIATAVQMTKYAEDKDTHISSWYYNITQAAGEPTGTKKITLSAKSQLIGLLFYYDFNVEVTWDTTPPKWKDTDKVGIYNHISGPQEYYLFFHEGYDTSPFQYIFYGNEQSPPFDGIVEKVVLSSTYTGYTNFDSHYNQLRYYGIRLQDNPGLLDTNMAEYACTHYGVEERWNFILDQPSGSDGIFGGPCIGDVNNDGQDDIVVGARNKTVYVYGGQGTGNDNTIIWSYVTGGEIQCTPALVDLNADGKLEVIVASDDMNVYALDGNTGLPYWTQPAPNPDATNFLMHGTPAIAQFNDGAVDVVIGCGNGYLIALNGEDGSEIWEYKAQGGIVGTPGVSDVNDDGTPDVCVGSYDTYIHMVNGLNGKSLWTYYVGPGLYNVQNSPVMVDLNGDSVNDVVIGGKLTGDFPGRLFALDGKSGNEIWAPVEIYGNACRTPAPVKINDDDVWDFILTTYFSGVYSYYGIDGLTGQIIYNRLTPGINPSAKFNYSSVISGDFTGDGHMNAMFSYTDANADPSNQTGFIDLVNVADEGLPGDWDGFSLFQMQISSGKKAEITAPPAVGDVDNDGELELIACTMRGRTHVLDMHAPVPTDPEQMPWPQHMGSRWHNGIPCFIPPN